MLDLTVPERLPQDSPPFGLPNVLVAPHIAGSMGLELARPGDATVDEVRRIAAGRPLLHPVTVQHLERSARRRSQGLDPRPSAVRDHSRRGATGSCECTDAGSAPDPPPGSPDVPRPP